MWLKVGEDCVGKGVGGGGEQENSVCKGECAVIGVGTLAIRWILC